MDYASDSDLGAYQAATPPPPPLLTSSPPPPSIPDLNLAVLRHYLPSISHLLGAAHHAKAYVFAGAAAGWTDHNREGPLFVCAQQSQSSSSSYADARPRACIFVLNRQSTENLVVDLAAVDAIEETDQFLILRVAGDDGDEDGFTLGLFLHQGEGDAVGSRREIAGLIRSMWGVVRGSHS